MASSSSLTVAIASEPDSLDPALTFDGNAFLIGTQLYETLISFAPNDLSPRPGLADKWSVSADGLVWTFNIPRNLKFHNGATLDAFAIAANFNRWWVPTDPNHTGTFEYFSYLFGGFKGDPGCLLINVEAPDAATFQIPPDEATRLNDVQANRVQVAFDINSATPITDANVRSMWRPGL